jgi:hypothetical protein
MGFIPTGYHSFDLNTGVSAEEFSKRPSDQEIDGVIDQIFSD